GEPRRLGFPPLGLGLRGACPAPAGEPDSLHPRPSAPRQPDLVALDGDAMRPDPTRRTTHRCFTQGFATALAMPSLFFSSPGATALQEPSVDLVRFAWWTDV